MSKDHLLEIGSRWAFELSLEVWRPKLVAVLRKWLKRYSVEDIRQMVSRGRFPKTSELNFSAVAGYAEYIEKIPLERLVEEFFLPARPDLIQVLQEMGMPAAKWLAKLRIHLLDKVKQGEKPAEAGVSKKDMVLATCDICSRSWPVPKEEVEAIEECPFCHHKNDEPSPEAS